MSGVTLALAGAAVVLTAAVVVLFRRTRRLAERLIALEHLVADLSPASLSTAAPARSNRLPPGAATLDEPPTPHTHTIIGPSG